MKNKYSPVKVNEHFYDYKNLDSIIDEVIFYSINKEIPFFSYIPLFSDFTYESSAELIEYEIECIYKNIIKNYCS